MGLDIQNAKFLSFCKKLGVDFSSTLTIGRQRVVINDKTKICKTHDFHHKNSIMDDDYADSYLVHLGAKKIDVCDASPYEGANIILDLNQPPPDYLESSYSCVIDFGTLEHIFNFTRALKTTMSSVAEGGHLIIATPANNLMGHGFYQLSPELFLRAFSEENGFEIVTMILADQYEESPWYEINLSHRPTELAKRFVAPSNWKPTYLLVLGKRKSLKSIFNKFPQQMSYESMWNKNVPSLNENVNTLLSFRKEFISKIFYLVKKSPFIGGFRKIRAVLSNHELPDYYRLIPSKVWMKF